MSRKLAEAMLVVSLGVAAAGWAGEPGGGPAPKAPDGAKKPAAPHSVRPPCPPGWTDFDCPLLGLKAHVPPGFTVHFRGDTQLSVERPRGMPAAAAFLIPFKPNKGAGARELAQMADRFFTGFAPQYRGQLFGSATPDCAAVAFSVLFSDQPSEGRFIATFGAKGAMAYVFGVLAAQGRLAAELPVLDRVVRSLAIYNRRGEWAPYKSPGGGFTLRIPKGWEVATSEGKIPKNEVDWVAFDPKNPGARAFSFTPKFCTGDLLQQLTYQSKGYRMAVFQTAEQCLQAALSQYFPRVQLTSVQPNQLLTQVVNQQEYAQINEFLRRLDAGQFSAGLYECFATDPADGAPLQLAFTARIDQSLSKRIDAAPSVQTDVWCKGWAAPRDQFLDLSPVLERIADSMEYTPQYLAMVRKAEAQRAAKVRETDKYCRKAEAEIWKERLGTDAYIAKIWGNFWGNQTSVVDPETGELKDVDNDKVERKDANGNLIMKDEARDADPAKRPREATEEDLMKDATEKLDFGKEQE